MLLGGVRLISVAIPQAALAGFTCLLIGLAAFRAAPQRKELAAVLASCLVLINLRLAMYVGYISPTALVGCLTAVAMEAVTGR